MGIMREKVEKNIHDEARVEKHLVKKTNLAWPTQATFKRSVTTKPNPNQTDRFKTAVCRVHC